MRKVYINLLSTNLEVSKKFYTALGFTVNEEFTNEQAMCIVASETIHFMLLTPPFFEEYVTKGAKTLANPKTQIQQVNSFDAKSKAEVDELANAATQNGGQEFGELQDLGFMYARDFTDPDGNVLGFFWMNPEFIG